jgi:hypothetical protein
VLPLHPSLLLPHPLPPSPLQNPPLRPLLNQQPSPRLPSLNSPPPNVAGGNSAKSLSTSATSTKTNSGNCWKKPKAPASSLVKPPRHAESSTESSFCRLSPNRTTLSLPT